MAKMSIKPGTLLGPLPVGMVSCMASDGTANIITIAWLGIVNSDPPMLSISVRKSRHSHKMIMDSGEFVVNLVNSGLVSAADICGVKSGAQIDKFKECGLTKEASENVKAPSITESPVSIECVVRNVLELGSHDMFLSEIVGVRVDEKLFDDDGKIDLSSSDLVSYLHGDYYSSGKRLGFFGYSVAAPEVLERRMKKYKSKNEEVKKS